MKDLLLVGNGHGEDDIAVRIFDALKRRAPHLSADAWAMVGEGAAYRSKDLTLVGPANRLPSAGFATLSLSLMLKDLGAGWIGTHYRQYKAARKLRGAYRSVLAVGDIVPLGAALQMKSPFVFVASAKSAYYPGTFQGFAPFETSLMRRAPHVFVRDALSAATLSKAGLNVRYAGNPVMDGLEPSRDATSLADGKPIIAMLAGTRADAEDNVIALLAGASAAARVLSDSRSVRFVFAAHRALGTDYLSARLEKKGTWRLQVPQAADVNDGIALRLRDAGGAEALIVKNRFADILHCATLAVGMAGTANEQAVGLGVPLIAVPSQGPQGANYVAMKQHLFGDAAITVAADPETVGAAISGLLADEARRIRMGAVGRERMGGPGASDAIAAELLALLGEAA